MVHIVDDDKSIRRALTMLAKSANFEVDVFESADKFLECNSINNNDCLILDIHMPGKNGFDLLRILKERRVVLKIIILTAFDDAANRERHDLSVLKRFSENLVIHRR